MHPSSTSSYFWGSIKHRPQKTLERGIRRSGSVSTRSARSLEVIYPSRALSLKAREKYPAEKTLLSVRAPVLVQFAIAISRKMWSENCYTSTRSARHQGTTWSRTWRVSNRISRKQSKRWNQIRPCSCLSLRLSKSIHCLVNSVLRECLPCSRRAL